MSQESHKVAASALQITEAGAYSQTSHSVTGPWREASLLAACTLMS